LKPTREWTEADLQALVETGAKETLSLQLKGPRALEKSEAGALEISKEVSSFANAAGGVIVYGMSAENGAAARLEGIDPASFSREWLDQAITTGIQRGIDGLQITTLELESRPGKVVYLVEVPESSRAPHQAADKRFYKRSGNAPQAMEEYEIRDVRRRVSAPDLHGDIAVNLDPAPFAARGPQGPFQLWLSVENTAEQPALHVIGFLEIDYRLQPARPNGTPYLHNEPRRTFSDPSAFLTRVQCNWSSPPKMPIFFGARFYLNDEFVRITVPKEHNPGDWYYLRWELKAPNMEPRHGWKILRIGAQSLQMTRDSILDDQIEQAPPPVPELEEEPT
jgi:hypothetical protein